MFSSSFSPSRLAHTEPTSPSNFTTQPSSNYIATTSSPFHFFNSDIISSPQDEESTNFGTFYDLEQSFFKDSSPEEHAQHDFAPLDIEMQQHLNRNLTPESEPAAQQAKPKRTRTKNLTEDQKTEKRQKFLERNKAAAAKCRSRKMQWTSNLTAKIADKQRENTMLKNQLESLRTEKGQLVNALLDHREQDGATCLVDPGPEALHLARFLEIPLPEKVGELLQIHNSWQIHENTTLHHSSSPSALSRPDLL